MEDELIVFNDPKSPISEVFRTLRTNIQFMSERNGAQCILVTSTNAGEGKSWITSNLATALAQAGNNVIIIDTDMRKGRLYHIFSVNQKPGLSNYLAESGNVKNESKKISNYIQHTNVKNLDVMTGGNIPPNPSELLGLPTMQDLLWELKERYDIVILDGTPCDLVTDSLILARIVDSVVVTIAVKETKKANLKRVIENIENVGGNILGVIANKMPVSAKQYQKTSYYGSSSSSSRR